ncbi:MULTISPECIES: TadE/TadG family type IV pilus assembly protein [unclassified Bosea (in: a-proteobacteria)]|uniref:TadE/TadG family type IV pilus assembly protein n=1 Tax=unclassified Bosea (in: a-proteobacteria) TaxID=2653178 RepID=UPI000F764E6A|nr:MULTISPECIES: TadE/TadG family type IV pilus assembly protein [unclassified Bosea (in: a-proteobacteria)]AZO78773.1 hypothetical protein BLM15_14925 [Bosea sp. Tri-49]RXT17439.1 hypothetical protein B5U98_25505 [Bosea sp. Tri-39]RXT40811.1 hypothetical protein B5U99_03375 [Bosea sp. Tri-54]
MKLSPSSRRVADVSAQLPDQQVAFGKDSSVLTLGCARQVLYRKLRAFGGDNAGATAVEFGFVGLLFLTVLFAFVQFSLLFLAGINLENALSDAATGNTAATYANDRSTVTERICSRMVLADDCQTKLKLEMQPLKNYPTTGQEITGTVFTVGEAGKDVTLIRARVPIITIIPGLPALSISSQAMFLRPV